MNVSLFIKTLWIGLMAGSFVWSPMVNAEDNSLMVPPKSVEQTNAELKVKQEVSTARALEQVEKTAKNQELLQKIEISLNKIHSMKASFIQRAPDGSVAEGMLYLERPGKLRFDFGDTAPFLVVSNGSLLTFVDYEVKQVSRWPIKKTPLGILVDEEIRFDKSVEVPDIVRFAGLIKVPVIDPERQEYGFITLIFEESTLELRAWEVVDAQGYTTRVALVNPEYNVAIDSKEFTFKDPRPVKHGPRRR